VKLSSPVIVAAIISVSITLSIVDRAVKARIIHGRSHSVGSLAVRSECVHLSRLSASHMHARLFEPWIAYEFRRACSAGNAASSERTISWMKDQLTPRSCNGGR
jgi:hypothetical protein